MADSDADDLSSEESVRDAVEMSRSGAPAVGRVVLDTLGLHHDRWAAAEAAELLEAKGVAPGRIDAVERCIRSHSIRSNSPAPESMEAQLLSDADKLDALGARGLVRLSCIVGERSGRAGEKYAVIDDASALGVPSADCPDISILREWMRERLDHLYTAPGRRIGESRWRFVNEFFEQFDRESGPDART
jgi:uncharacterized protein